ncbi:hypothetical protein [Rufibacter quisquiliarum]|uniref:Uncharacterized protein n=1 Tax=Rufibacter quisquiliarum TaxID=1549639 RepID=A0A839GCK9_9BACT|nr:hypothetical protein [Rufibacter quisquiliarum]MBA9076100.1 hypothetical protein [Rufibacter quisquiliarum]
MPKTRLEYSQMQGSFHFDDTAKQKNRDTNTYYTISEGVEWDLSRNFIEAMFKKYPSLKNGALSWTKHPSVEDIKKEFGLFMLDNQSPIEDRITVGRLREELSLFSDDCEIIFSDGGLYFQRAKRRGDNLVQIEFSQNVYRDKEGKFNFEG